MTLFYARNQSSLWGVQPQWARRPQGLAGAIPACPLVSASHILWRAACRCAQVGWLRIGRYPMSAGREPDMPDSACRDTSPKPDP